MDKLDCSSLESSVLFIILCSVSSKFVPRESVRIDTVVAGSTLETVAFLTPDKTVVVVVMNRQDHPVTFKLLDIVDGSKQAVRVTALARSIQTFMYH